MIYCPICWIASSNIYIYSNYSFGHLEVYPQEVYRILLLIRTQRQVHFTQEQLPTQRLYPM